MEIEYKAIWADGPVPWEAMRQVWISAGGTSTDFTTWTNETFFGQKRTQDEAWVCLLALLNHDDLPPGWPPCGPLYVDLFDRYWGEVQ